MKFNTTILISILFLLLFSIESSYAKINQNQSYISGDTVTWKIGTRTFQSVISEDEVALFPLHPSRSNRTAIRAEGQKLGRIIHEAGSLIITKSSTALRGTQHRERIRSIKNASFRRAAPVLYRNGRKAIGAIMVPTGEVVVHLAPFISAEVWAESFGVKISKKLFNNIILVDLNDAFDAIDFAKQIEDADGVIYAYPNIWEERTKRNDPLYPDQWHLENTGQQGGAVGEDVRIANVWNSYRGSGSIIAIVDDGLDEAHEDLTDNVLSGWGWNWTTNNSDPSPVMPDDGHGTACGGVAAARGFNLLGGRGAAPYAYLVGYNLLSNSTFDNEAEALSKNNSLIEIYSNSWGPSDDGLDLGLLTPVVEAALVDGITNGRNGKGNIFVFAGGNGQGEGDNSNYDGYANSRYTIAVSAVTNLGEQSYYSESGANIIVSAPSSGGADSGIVTTDVTGAEAGYSPGDGSPDPNYTITFGGTSSAAPLVSGIASLMLEANRDLTWRDVRDVMLTTARKNNPADPEWTQNGAGYWIHHGFGFGVINAESAVTTAHRWVSSGAEVSYSGYSSSPGLSIPDDDPAGVDDAIFLGGIPADFKIEYVEITFSASDHPYWGDLQITLTSPSGTISRLSELNPNGAGQQWDGWKFGSIRHFGESPNGVWSLNVADMSAPDEGTLESWSLTFYGTTSPGYEDTLPPTTPILTPKNGQSVSFPLLLDWSDCSDTGRGLSHYILEVDDDSSFASPIQFVTALSETQVSVGNGAWYWRVSAYDLADNYSVSTVDSFVVADAAPPEWISISASPSYFLNSNSQLVTVSIKISDNEGIDSIALDLSRFALSSSFAASQVDTESWTASFTVPSGLDSGIHLFKVSAVDFGANEIDTFANISIGAAVIPSATLNSNNLPEFVDGNYISLVPENISSACAGILYQYRSLGDSEWRNIEASSNPEAGPPFSGIFWERPDTAVDGKYEFRVLGILASGAIDSYGILTLLTLDSELSTSTQFRDTVEGTITRIDAFEGDETSQIAGGILLSVPSSAISNTVWIEMIRYLSSFSPPLPSTLHQVGPAAEFNRIDGIDTFSSDVRIAIPIADTVISEEVGLYYYDGSNWRRVSNAWVSDSKVFAEVSHFTLFVPCTGALPAESTLVSVIIYPNPFIPNDGNSRNGLNFSVADPATGIIFENLTGQATIEIFDISGRLVARMQKSDNEGRYRWDARGIGGKEVSSGIYLAIISSGAERIVKKIMIIR